jgi:hypothetical protein
MERAFKIGCKVVFFDSQRVEHEALVTNWFHAGDDGETLEQYNKRCNLPDTNGFENMPCCNIVWVSSDKSKEDPYGRQLERATSISHGRSQGMVPFVGYCWAWPDELEEARKLVAESFDKAVAK